ncbi:hypothetical protein PVK06_013132 [Gossypium arboreum]|uniref:Thaumatin-like protein n=1 Tax=Gossypium arboreum TaxID=29729 RepID=A0ABR0QEG5_GOSAR|nr:hypothetical protein PVK06_013132 [Gossypium arboreum]
MARNNHSRGNHHGEDGLKGWSGRLWGRTDCDFGKNGSSSCQTGSCGSSINCTMDLTLPIVIKPTSDVACLPTNYPKSFKQVCPVASCYAYKEAKSNGIFLSREINLLGEWPLYANL